MSSQLDEISEAIGQLRASVLSNTLGMAELSKRIENASDLIRRDMIKGMDDIRERHHAHNNEVMRQLGKMEYESMQKYRDYDERIDNLEHWKTQVVTRTISNRAWLAAISGVVGAVSSLIVEWFRR